MYIKWKRSNRFYENLLKHYLVLLTLNIFKCSGRVGEPSADFTSTRIFIVVLNWGYIFLHSSQSWLMRRKRFWISWLWTASYGIVRLKLKTSSPKSISYKIHSLILHQWDIFEIKGIWLPKEYLYKWILSVIGEAATIVIYVFFLY